jgi:hypothetical protein
MAMWTRCWRRPRRSERAAAPPSAIAWLRSVVAAAALLASPAAAAAQDGAIPVDLELVIAVDVSGSIDADEARLQRNGYVSAFANADVIGAITSGMHGRIAVTYMEWAGAQHVRTVVDWTLLDGAASAHAFSASLARAPIETELWTSISHAIAVSIPKFNENRFAGVRKVIDISGDGPNNQGGLVTNFRDRAVAAGITINGLPIVNDRVGPWGWPPLPDLDLYYAACVIGGNGAFYVVANDFADFARAVRQKLLLEIAGVMPAGGRERLFKAAAQEPGRKPPPCDAGERHVQWLLDER